MVKAVSEIDAAREAKVLDRTIPFLTGKNAAFGVQTEEGWKQTIDTAHKLGLVEKAQAAVTQEEAERLGDRLKKGEFTLEDFLEQLQQVKKMGPISGLMGMLPGMPKELKNAEIGDDQVKVTEAIIRSMTREERARPEIINGSRRTRIARGSGTEVADVNRLIKQFAEMQKMMKQMGGLAGRKAGKKGKPPKMNPVKMAKAMKQMGSGDLSGLGNLAGGAGFPGNPGLPGTKNGEAFPDFREFR